MRGWDQSDRLDEAWALVAATYQREVHVLSHVVDITPKPERKRGVSAHHDENYSLCRGHQVHCLVRAIPRDPRTLGTLQMDQLRPSERAEGAVCVDAPTVMVTVDESTRQ